MLTEKKIEKPDPSKIASFSKIFATLEVVSKMPGCQIRTFIEVGPFISAEERDYWVRRVHKKYKRLLRDIERDLPPTPPQDNFFRMVTVEHIYGCTIPASKLNELTSEPLEPYEPNQFVEDIPLLTLIQIEKLIGDAMIQLLETQN